MKIPIILFFFAFSLGSQAQNIYWVNPSDSTMINYSGGMKHLHKDIVMYLFHHHNAVDEALIDSNRYSIVEFTVSANGRIGYDITVYSVEDTALIPVIMASIRQTEGKWINYSKKNQKVLLPVYFQYQKKDGQLIPLSNIVVRSTGSIIYLKPSVTIIYQPIVDRSIHQ